MKKLMVSIIVPTYRREMELKKALDSLRELEYDSYEIIVVDDNGDAIWNRKVEEQVRTFQNDNPNIIVKYIANSLNMGSARTRNIGIAVAEGEYICFLDDDDIYLPKRVKHQVEAMQQEDADFSITDLALYDSKENLIEVRKRDYVEDTSVESLMRYHLMYHMTGTDTLMFKKEYLDAIGGFDPIDSGDEFYLMLKAIEHGGKFLYVPICDVKAYVHVGNDGLSSGKGKIAGENQLYEFKKTRFSDLDKKTIRYIRMRHHAVLAFAYLRMKKLLACGIEAIKSFFIYPKGLLAIWRNRKRPSCNPGKKIGSSEIKKMSFEVLCDFKEVCEKHGLTYSLTGGTLLGAVRHKGFIPWDDDVDVMMPRPDYDRLMQIAKTEEFKFNLYSAELNGKEYGYPFAKACHKGTLVEEKGVKKRGIQIGVYVDIFPIDGMGNTYKQAKRHFGKFKFFHGLKVTSNWTKYHTSKTRKWYFEPVRFCCYLLSKVLSDTYISHIMYKIIQKYTFLDSKYAGRMVGDRGKGEINEKKVFEQITKLEFENELFDAVADYDTFLTNAYGDYMKLPPLEKRVTHHDFEAFMIEN